MQRATCDGDFAALAADTGSTATAHADAEFEEGESYTYRVRARRPQGLSLWSGTQTLLVPGGAGESEVRGTHLPPVPGSGPADGPHPGDAGEHPAGLRRGGGDGHAGAE